MPISATASPIFAAAGVSDADRLVFPFSFGPFVGFWGAFEAAVALRRNCSPTMH